MNEFPWRPLLALFANPHAANAAARIVLGADLESAIAVLPSKRRESVTESLRTSGLIDTEGQPNIAVFRQSLDASSKQRPSGVFRFVRGPRIEHWPVRVDDRIELLAWVQEFALEPSESVSEAILNERLRVFHADVAYLRRQLVDHGFIVRSANGAEYRSCARQDSVCS